MISLLAQLIAGTAKVHRNKITFVTPKGRTVDLNRGSTCSMATFHRALIAKGVRQEELDEFLDGVSDDVKIFMDSRDPAKRDRRRAQRIQRRDSRRLERDARQQDATF